MAVDSGADHHFLGRGAEVLVGKMLGGAKALHVATGAANVKVKMCSVAENNLGVVGGAAYSTQLRHSLLSVSQLAKAGWRVCFGGSSFLEDKWGVRHSMEEHNGLYWVKVQESTAHALVTKAREHERKAHFWTPTGRAQNCDACVMNKGQAPPHKKERLAKYKSEKKGDAVHFDYVGPMEVTSAGGARWVLNAVDDYDGWVESYPVASKVNAADALQKFADKHGAPKQVRTDNDPTFVAESSAWSRKVKELGAVATHSAPYMPQQNGKVERHNRTLTDGTRTVLHGVDPTLWGFAAKYAAYTWNRVDGRHSKSPYFKRYGREPGVKHLKRFGCRCWFRNQNRTKLEQKYREGVFLGYAEASPAYLVGHYKNDGRLQVSVSADVKFREDELVGNMDKLKAEAARQEVVTGLPEEGVAEWNTASRMRRELAAAAARSKAPAQGSGPEKDVKRTRDELAAAAAEESRKRTKGMQACEDAAVAMHGAVAAKEARKGPEKEKWAEAEAVEREALDRMGVWEPVKKSEMRPGESAIPIVILYNTKADGRYKARAVALGNKQSKNDVAYECYSPTVSHLAIRLAIVAAASRGEAMCQYDISNAFVNAPLLPEERVFARLPPQWGGQIVRLRKALYGLRSAPRHWYDHFSNTLQEKLGWERSQVEPGTFRKKGSRGNTLTMVLYVDDGLICGPEHEVKHERNLIFKEFKGKAIDPEYDGLCEVRTLLGVRVRYNRGEKKVSLSQGVYAKKVADKFKDPKWAGGCKQKGHLKNDGPIVPKEQFDYQSCIGALNYLVAMTRPDLAWVVSQLSRFLSEPRESAVREAVRVAQYVGDTCEMGLVYRSGRSLHPAVPVSTELIGFCDSDYAGCPTSRKSTTGCIVFCRGCPVWWRSSLQPIVTTSSAEAEYVALFTLVKELAHIAQVFRFLQPGGELSAPIVLCDNASTVKMAESTVATKRSRHIDVRWHYVREQLKSGAFKLKWVPTSQQRADGLTKPLPERVRKNMVEVCTP